MINTTKLIRTIRLAGVALFALLLMACAAQTRQPGAAEQPADAYSFEPWEGDGMEIPLDGSSLDAFNASLARVKAYTSPEDYTTLSNAIDYLLFYDLSARRDRAALAAQLDGLTPKQVIDKVEDQRGSENRAMPGVKAPDSTNEL